MSIRVVSVNIAQPERAIAELKNFIALAETAPAAPGYGRARTTNPRTVGGEAAVLASAHVAEQILDRVLLLPEGGQRLSMRQMNQLKDDLVALSRSELAFTATEEVGTILEADFTAAYVRDPRLGRSVGLVVTRTGQQSCWESLPRATQLHMPVLDPERTQERITDLLRLLLRVHDAPQTRFAPALAIDPAEIVTVVSLDSANVPNRAALARGGRGGPVQIKPDETWDAAIVDAAAPTIAEELTLKLMHHFRSPHAHQQF